MSDTRTTPSNGRVAHLSLRGHVEAERFTEGTPAVVVVPVANLTGQPEHSPCAPILRQLLMGEAVQVLDHQQGNAFVIASKDGYVGWTPAQNLSSSAMPAATHVVCAAATHRYRAPNIKTSGAPARLSMGTRLHVTGQEGAFARVFSAAQGAEGSSVYVPSRHLRPIDDFEADPIAVAERLLGTPYLWGGNSSLGIDCSGLVQIGLTACGLPCPGDSDMQEDALGETLPSGTAPQRGDLMFWKGHVAWVSDAQTLLHANAHDMAVAYEPIDTAIARIKRQGDGPVTRHARLS